MKRLLCFLVALVLILSFSVPTGAYSNVYKSNRSAGKRVALTFDDGPHPIFTGRILDILERYNAKATFFVVGQNVENYPRAFERLADSDCEIGNHTYTHKNIGNMSEDELLVELERTEKAIESISRRHTLLLRPPEGHFGDAVRRVSVVRGYDIILWSIDTLDWAHTPPDKISASVVSSLDKGDIILMHDYTSRGNSACEALGKLIPRMLELGYEFVSVSELIGEE